MICMSDDNSHKQDQQSSHGGHMESKHKGHHHADHSSHEDHGRAHARHDPHDYADMVNDFSKRFYIPLHVALPILSSSPMIPSSIGVHWQFPSAQSVLFIPSSFLL